MIPGFSYIVEQGILYILFTLETVPGTNQY